MIPCSGGGGSGDVVVHFVRGRRSSSKLKSATGIMISKNKNKKPLWRGLLIMNPSQSTMEWALVANEEEKIHGPCSIVEN